MKKYNLRINFCWDDEDDMREFSVIVPNKVTVDDVYNALIRIHKYLDREDKTETYGHNGRNPETLLIYVCEEYGWRWEELKFDIDINLD